MNARIVVVAGLAAIGAVMVLASRPELPSAAAPKVSSRRDRGVALLAPAPPAIVSAEPVADPVPIDPPIDPVVHATSFANEMCACSDLSCTVEVDARYRDQLGRVGRTRDGHALHEAFSRSSACQLALQPTRD